MFLLLTLKIPHTFSNVYIADFEEISVTLECFYFSHSSDNCSSYEHLINFLQSRGVCKILSNLSEEEEEEEEEGEEEG